MTDSTPPQDSETAGTETPPAPAPRDFVISTGDLYARVGMIALALSCPLSILAPRLADPDVHADGTGGMAGMLTAEHLGTTAYNADVLATLIGSLALMAAGWALQGEMRRGPTVAMAVTGLLALLYLAAGAGAVLGAWFVLLFSLVLCAGAVVMFLLAARSAIVIRRHPPEKTRGELAEEGIEAYRERRRRRLKEFE